MKTAKEDTAADAQRMVVLIRKFLIAKGKIGSEKISTNSPLLRKSAVKTVTAMKLKHLNLLVKKELGFSIKEHNDNA